MIEFKIVFQFVKHMIFQCKFPIVRQYSIKQISIFVMLKKELENKYHIQVRELK